MTYIKNGLIAATFSFALLAVGGCASVIHESKQSVTIKSEPPGATLTIDNRTFTTPAIVALKGKSEYPFTLTAQGYKPAIGKVDSEFRVWSVVLGNIVNLTGLIGVGVDVWGTGAAYELQKDNTITLEPDPAAVPVSSALPGVPVAVPQPVPAPTPAASSAKAK